MVRIGESRRSRHRRTQSRHPDGDDRRRGVRAPSCAELDEDEIQEISGEIARVQALTPEEAEGVLEEFYQMTVAHDYVIKGGVEYARKVLVTAFGAEKAASECWTGW